MPCHLEIALKGLNARRVLKLLRAIKLSCFTNKLDTETITIKQSRIVQTEVKYLTNPKAIHLRNISTVNITAKVRFK